MNPSTVSSEKPGRTRRSLSPSRQLRSAGDGRSLAMGGRAFKKKADNYDGLPALVKINLLDVAKPPPKPSSFEGVFDSTTFRGPFGELS